VVEDIETDPTYAGFRAIARAGGFRAVHATPIVNRAGNILGVISVHFEAPRRPTRMEMQFADMCARYAADAIETKHSEMALREADRRKDEFLATLAHELRNPLAPIRNGLYLLRLADRSSDAAEQARAMMDRQMNHLVRLVDDLLEVSRISTGKLELRKERVELASVVGSATETSRPVIDAKRHTLRIELPRDALALHADPIRLAQVLANILNNAAKYTEDGGEIRLSVRRDGDAALISVRDNGMGIPREMLPRIFDMFMQVDGAARHSQGGLGIGLTLARRLVELHDGTIEVRSEGPGRGSEFLVRLPVLPLPDELGGARLRGVAFQAGR
jgi:signal transduction histidine kinase